MAQWRRKREKGGVRLPLFKEILKAYYVAKKDMKIYYFTPPSLTWGIVLPVFLFLAFASGLRGSGDMQFLIPGLVGMTLLFSTTSVEAVAIVFEKMEGTFERLLLSPVSFKTIIFGKAMAGLSFGLLTASVVLILAVIFTGISINSVFSLLTGIILSGLVFSAIGLTISVYVSKMWEAMAMANFLRFPMVFICGAFIPISSLPEALQWIAYFLPLTYSVDLIRWSLTGKSLFPNYIDMAALALYFLILWTIGIKALYKSLE